MFDDEYNKMRAMLKAAEDAVKLSHTLSTDEIVRLTGYHTDWQSQFDSITAMVAADQLSIRNLLSPSLENELRSLSKALEPPPAINHLLREIEAAVRQAEQAMKAMNQGILSPAVLSGYSSLGNMLHDIGIQAAEIPTLSGIDIASGLLAPVEQYGKFLQDTVARLSAIDVEPMMSRALEGSILLAGDVLGANATITASMDASGAGSPGTPQVAPSRLILPFVLRDDLIASREDLPSLDVDELASHSPAHDAATRENRILQAIADVNTARRLAGEEETFTPTTRLIVAMKNLVFLVVRDIPTCGEFLDTLYFLLYESAGKDHLRYHESAGGRLTDDECEIIWRIKHLRAYFRHDTDHGKPADVRKKWRELRDDLQTLGFDKMPTSELEFRRLQARLIEEVERFVTTLRSRS